MPLLLTYLFLTLALASLASVLLHGQPLPALLIGGLLLIAGGLSWRIQRRRRPGKRTADKQDTLSRRREGAERFARGDVKGALEVYNRNLSLDVSNSMLRGVPHRLQAALYTERGQIHFAQKQYQLALRDFESAHTASPKFHPALAWLAIVHYALRDLDEAYDFWRRALALQSEYSTLNGLTWVRQQPGWLSPPIVEAQAITALLNARR